MHPCREICCLTSVIRVEENGHLANVTGAAVFLLELEIAGLDVDDSLEGLTD
jgi:hypothetical protein